MQTEESELGREAAPPTVRNLSKTQIAVFALKIAVTLACFWYLFRHIDVTELRRTLPGLDAKWALLAICLLIMQIPLLGLRWLQIAKTLRMRGRQLTFIWMSIATAIGQFFGQIMPVVAGDGVRVWFLARFSRDWRNATISVVIDRCVGIGLLLTFTFAILLLPSSFGAFEQERDRVAMIPAITTALSLACLVGSAALSPSLTKWKYGRWFDRFFGAPRCSARVLRQSWASAPSFIC